MTTADCSASGRTLIAAAAAMLWLIANPPVVGAQLSRPPRLSLADAIAAARANNGSLREADEGLEQARITREVAHAAFRPKIVPNVLGAIGQPDLSSQAYGLNASQRFTTGTEVSASVATSASRNQLGTFYYTDTTFLLTQPVFGGSTREGARRELAEAERGVDSATGRREMAEQRLIVDVANAYYTIVGQQQVVAATGKARERCAKLLDVSRAKLAIGKVSQLDVLRAEQVLREADGRLLDARAAAEDARDQLSLLMGRPAGAAFDVDPDIPLSLDPLDLDAAVKTALERRPDVRSARRAAEDAEHAAGAARRMTIPELDVKLALTRREAAPNLGSSFGFNRFRLVPFAAVSMPLDRPGERETSVLQEQRARSELDRLQAQIAVDVRRAVRRHDRLAHALDSAEAAVDFATKELDVATERFRRGLSSNLDVVSAETDLLAAQSRRIDAIAALAVARLEFLATIGTLDATSR